MRIQERLMYRPILKLLSLIMLSAAAPLWSDGRPEIIVAQDGSGDFTRIQDAVNQIPANNKERIHIFIKAGIYEEKLFIEKDCITLEGEDSSSTIIRYAELRSAWRKTHPDDWGAATVNLNASDFIMRNLSVINDYGLLHDEHDHQFGVRLMSGTRIIFENCRFISGGGDTVSLWDKEKGQYYHKNCHFEGYVDLLCPRGWCYVEGSTFYQHKQTATLWLDGSEDSTKRLVVRNSRFDGVEGFRLGRRHYDAEFILMDCHFSAALADEPIYRVTYPEDPARNRPNLWGDRNYFKGSKREGGNFNWLEDNFEGNSDLPTADSMNAKWTFGGTWNPENVIPPEIRDIIITDRLLTVLFDESMTVKGIPTIVMDNGLEGDYSAGSGTSRLQFILNQIPSPTDGLKYFHGKNAQIFSSKAYVNERRVIVRDRGN